MYDHYEYVTRILCDYIVDGLSMRKICELGHARSQNEVSDLLAEYGFPRGDRANNRQGGRYRNEYENSWKGRYFNSKEEAREAIARWVRAGCRGELNDYVAENYYNHSQPQNYGPQQSHMPTQSYAPQNNKAGSGDGGELFGVIGLIVGFIIIAVIFNQCASCLGCGGCFGCRACDFCSAGAVCTEAFAGCFRSFGIG